MSLDKIKSAKNVTYTDRYSKNPIINNLIKTKIDTEMISIKQSFSNIIKKDKQLQTKKTITTNTLRRNKSISINPKLIKQAIQYNPLDRLNKFAEQFVANRQIQSFLIPTEQLKQINQARQEYSGLTTKFKKSDIIKYQTGKDFNLLAHTIQQKTIKQYSQNVWLPNKPQIKYLYEDKKDEIEEQLSAKKTNKNSQNQTQKHLQNFTKKIIGKSQNQTMGFKKLPIFPLNCTKSLNQNLRPTQYIPQKYHKNDYKQIQSWLNTTMESIYQSKQNSQDKLNLIYSSYICVWKQIIRLTYIESEEKGLIIQKMFYSMLRLFGGLISEQQNMSKNYQAKLYAQNNQIQAMMKQRMEQLNKRFINQNKQIDQLKTKNHQISKGFISFQKVNRQLVIQLEKITKQKKQFQKEFYKIGNSFLKTLQILHDKHLIEMQFSQQQEKPKRKQKKNISTQYKSYFLFDHNSKPIVLGRFKYQDNTSTTPQYLDQLPNTSQELKIYNQRYGRNLKQIQNQLTRYWEKKQDDLQMKGIINSLILEVRLKDQNIGTQLNQTAQFQCQFPENQQNYIQSLLQQLRDELTEKFNKQKNQLYLQMQQKETIFSKWKTNFQQLQEKNKALHQNNLKLNEQIKKSKENLSQFLKNIDQLVKVNQKSVQQIQQLKKNLQNSKSWEQLAKQAQSKAQREKDLIKLQMERQKQNNKFLVRSSLQNKQKAQKFDIKYNNLLSSIKNVSPWLQKFMEQIEKPIQQIQISILHTVSHKIEQYLSQFVTKDSSLFMTRLT